MSPEIISVGAATENKRYQADQGLPRYFVPRFTVAPSSFAPKVRN